VLGWAGVEGRIEFAKRLERIYFFTIDGWISDYDYASRIISLGNVVMAQIYRHTNAIKWY
jgi:hypothetical protein